MKTLTVILVFLSASAAGDIIPTYEITRETLPGTWEAVADVYSVPFLYRMEIRGDTNSYLVSVAKSGDAPTRLTVLRMVGSEIVAGEVTLRFRGMEVDETLQVVFQGSGTMLNEAEGALRGKFSCTTEAFSPCLVRGEVNFKKGSWTRHFLPLSTEAEKNIEELRGPPKP